MEPVNVTLYGKGVFANVIKLMKEARNRFSPRASGESVILPTPCLWSNNTDLRFLVSRAVREQISDVLSHPVCDNLLQQPQETNTSPQVVFSLRI